MTIMVLVREKNRENVRKCQQICDIISGVASELFLNNCTMKSANISTRG